MAMTLAQAIAAGKSGMSAKDFIKQQKQDEVRKILQTSPYQSTGEALGSVSARLGNEFARKYLESTAPKPAPTYVPVQTPTAQPKVNNEPKVDTSGPGDPGPPDSGGGPSPDPLPEPIPEPEGPPDYDYMRKLKSIGVKLPKSPAQQQRRGGGTVGAFGRKGLRITSLNLA